MQILWATPFNTRSAIGVFSREICQELARRGCRIRIMRLESGPEAHWPTHTCSIEQLGPDDAIPLGNDIVVVNYGNHAPYHAGALRIAAASPAVAIFHDAQMSDFEWGLRNQHDVSIPPLLHENEPQDSQSTSSDLVDPKGNEMLVALSAMSAGAIVHGPHYLATVEGACAGPVRVIPLCFPDIGTSLKAHEPGHTRRVVIFGVISPHKQPERVLRAISLIQSEVGLVELHLAGAIEDGYRSELLHLATQLGIPEPIFYGYLPDQQLVDVLACTDVVCCLRYPVTEGGSASLITALRRVRPLIVSNIASYSMVPDEFVYKVSYGEDCNDLADALLQIFRDPAVALDKANRAVAWADETYSTKNYVDKLMPFLEAVIATLPLQLACRQLAASACMPNNGVMPQALKSSAQAIHELFEPSFHI